MACQEVLSGGDQGVDTREECLLGHLAAQRPPPHFNGLAPGPVGGQRQHHQAPRGAPSDGFDRVVGLRRRVIPRAIDALCGVLVQKRLAECGDLATPCVRFDEAHGLSRLVRASTKTSARCGLAWRGDHPWLAFWTPPGFEGRQPGASDRIGIVTDRPWRQAIAGRFTGLFLTC